MFDQHNVSSSVYFSVKAIISNLTSLVSGTSAFIWLNVIFARTSPPWRRPLWARPLKTEHAKLIVWRMLSRSSFWMYFWQRSWRKRIVRLVTTEKRLQVLKVTHCFFFSVVLTFRSSFCVSDVVREVSFFHRLRGKEEWNGPREHLIWFCCYRHSSSDDTKTYSIIQNLVGFKPTISVCLVIGNHNLPKSAIFKT